MVLSMRILSFLLLASWLPAQEPTGELGPKVVPLPRRLKLQAAPRSPQEMMSTLLALDQARWKQPGATVEVIGYDDEVVLRLLSLSVAEKVRLEYRATDKMQHRELRAFMQQDPSKPSPILFVPRPPGP